MLTSLPFRLDPSTIKRYCYFHLLAAKVPPIFDAICHLTGFGGGSNNAVCQCEQLRPIMLYVFRKSESTTVSGKIPFKGLTLAFRLNISEPFRPFSSTNLSLLWSI